MAEFDPNAPFEVVTPEFDPNAPFEAVGEESDEPKSISKSESALKGAQQGLLFGHADESEGFIESGLDLGQALLNKLGVAGPSVTQTNEKLASDGVKGDIGPQSTLDLYRQARDAARHDHEAAQQANPWSYGGGAVAGGLLTAKALPAGLTSPLGPTGDLPGMMRIAASGMNAAPLAAVGSFGLAGGDLLSNPDQVGRETANMIPMGIATAAGMTAGAEGLKAMGPVLGKAVPTSVKTAYRRGKEGINTTTQEWYDSVRQRLNDIVGDVSDPIIKKSKEQVAAHTENLAFLDDQLNTIKANDEKLLEMGQARQKVTNQQDLLNLNRKTVELAKQTESHVGKLKGDLGKSYDEIDSVIEASGAVPHQQNQEIISNFIERVKANAQPHQVEAIIKKLQPFFGKEMNSFRGLRNTLNQIGNESGDFAVKSAVRDATSEIKGALQKSLADNNLTEVAGQLGDLNRRWVLLNKLEDTFVNDAVRSGADIVGNLDTKGISTVTSFGQKNPGQINKSTEFTKALSSADPEGAENLLNQIRSHMGQVRQLETNPPQFQPPANPEIAKLEELISMAKMSKNPAVVEGVNLRTDPNTMKDQLTGLLPKYGMNTANDVAENTLDSTFNFLSREKGNNFVDGIKSKLKPLNQDIELRNAQVGADIENMPGSKTEFLRKLVVGPTTKGANVAGRAVRNVENTVAKTKEFLQKGVGELNTASPESLQALSQSIATKGGPEAAGYARVLNEAAGKKGAAKTAIIFGLMQQPEFRKYFNSVTDTTEDEK